MRNWGTVKSKPDNINKLRRIRGLDPDAYGRTWIGVILDVWEATYNNSEEKD